LAQGSSVLVIGSTGALGSIVAATFEEAGWSVLRGARRTPEHVMARLVDLDRPQTIEATLPDADLVVNPVADMGLAAERVVLRRGGRLINISALPDSPGRRLRAVPGQPKGTAILNAGRIPGLTNLLAAELLARHPKADAVEIATTLSASGTSGPQAGAFLHEHLAAERRHRTATIEFPAPFGRRRCLQFAEQENGWLGEVATGREVISFACLAQRPMQGGLLILNRLGLMRALPSAVFERGRKTSGEPSREAVAMWVGVRKGGELIGAASATCRGDYRSTAAITLAMAEAALERGGSLPAGCVDVEEVFTIAEMEQRLRDAGIEFEFA
jgi:hypothetical protein